MRTFVRAAVVARGGIADDLTTNRFAVRLPDWRQWSLTVDREEALADETLQLLGLEHPMVAELLAAEAELEARRRALLFDDGNAIRPENVQAIWEVQIQTAEGARSTRLYRAQADEHDHVICTPYQPTEPVELCTPGTPATLPPRDRVTLATRIVHDALQSHLVQTGYWPPGATYLAKLLAWVEFAGS